MIETSHEQAVSAAIEASMLQALRPGVIFSRTLQDSLPGLLVWAAGYSVLIVVVVVLYPILEENNMLLGVLNGLGLIDMVAANYPVDVNALASFPGYLAFEALGWGPTILSVFFIPQMINLIMGEESRGTLDLLLGTPITRWQLITEKMLAMVAVLVLVLLISLCSLLISVGLVPDTQLELWQAAAGTWHVLPMTLLVMSLTLLLSVSLRNSRVVGGLMALFLIGSFFLRSIADATGAAPLQELRRFSIYHYYSSIGAMLDGIRWVNDLAIVALAVLCFALAVYRFQRRELFAG